MALSFLYRPVHRLVESRAPSWMDDVAQDELLVLRQRYRKFGPLRS
jgi:hypothetical protein